MTFNDEQRRPDLAVLMHSAYYMAASSHAAMIADAFTEACRPAPSARVLRAYAIVFAWRSAQYRRVAHGPWGRPSDHLTARFWALVARQVRREARVAER